VPKTNFLCQAVSLRRHTKWFWFVCWRTSVQFSWNADWVTQGHDKWTH